MVVSMLLWPRRACISLMLTPFIRRWVAKLWRRVWTVACFTMPASLTAFPMALWMPLSLIWWRLTLPLRGSTDRLADGKTYCHFHSFAAFGYFLARAVGRYTSPCPADKSLSCRAFTFSMWSRRGYLTAPENKATWSWPHLPAQRT